MGNAKSSLLLKDDVVFVRVFWSLSLGCFGRLLHVFVAESNQVERCPVYLFFFWDWFSSGLEDGTRSWKHVVV